MAKMIKKTVKALETTTATVSTPVAGDNLQRATMADFGAMLGKADAARFNAAVFYAGEVKEGRATLDDAKKFAKWWDEGRCHADPKRKPSEDKALNVLVSQLKAFADPEVLKLDGKHYATVEAFFAANDKKALGNRDFFTCCYAANVGIKKDKPAKVDNAFLATRIKPKADGSTATADAAPKAGAKEASPEEKAAVTKSALTAAVKQARTTMVLSATQTMALNVMIEAFGITA